MRVVLFRCVSGRWGLGHLKRCAALAEQFNRRRWRVVFMVGGPIDDPGLARGRILRGPSWPGCENTTRTTAAALGKPVVVVDLPWARESAAELRAVARYIVCIDDTTGGEFPADLVVNPNLFAPKVSYTGCGRVLRGPRFAPIPSDIRRVRRGRRARRASNRILLTLGGADPERWTESILRHLVTAAPALTVRVVVGPAYRGRRSLAAVASGAAVEFVRSPDSLAPSMAWASAAVCSAGSTIYQMACAGVPVVTVSLDEAQERNGQALAREGGAIHLGPVRHLTARRLRAAVLRLVERRDVARRLASRGRRLVDGAGTARLYRRIAREAG